MNSPSARHPDLRLITATNTRAAGVALAEHGVDAILLDLAIPEEGGIALCRRIKAQARLRHIPVIALSALPAASTHCQRSRPAAALSCRSRAASRTSSRRCAGDWRRRLPGAMRRQHGGFIDRLGPAMLPLHARSGWWNRARRAAGDPDADSVSSDVSALLRRRPGLLALEASTGARGHRATPTSATGAIANSSCPGVPPSAAGCRRGPASPRGCGGPC